jgi:hypothetical protein
VLGPTGVGKSFIACALAQKACRDGCSAFYTRAAALFRDLALARADGSFRNLLGRLSRIDVTPFSGSGALPSLRSDADQFAPGTMIGFPPEWLIAFSGILIY